MHLLVLFFIWFCVYLCAFSAPMPFLIGIHSSLMKVYLFLLALQFCNFVILVVNSIMVITVLWHSAPTVSESLPFWGPNLTWNIFGEKQKKWNSYIMVINSIKW